MSKKTESEYAGTVPTSNSVQDLGPEGRELKSHEKLRLGYLTGQTEDPDAKSKSPGFMQGVDPDYPDGVDGLG
jgi:hypothetical protein